MSVFFLFLLSILQPALANRQVAVLEFEAANMSDAILLKLSESARVTARDVLPQSEFQLLMRENMVQILRDNELDPSCVEGGCEVETGRNIGADYIISGAVLPLEGQYLLTLKLFATETGNLLSAEETETYTELELLQSLKFATRALLAKGLNIVRLQYEEAHRFLQSDQPRERPSTCFAWRVKTNELSCLKAGEMHRDGEGVPENGTEAERMFHLGCGATKRSWSCVHLATALLERDALQSVSLFRHLCDFSSGGIGRSRL